LWYPERKGRCVVVGLLALAWGFGLGWLQQMRGAHFLSHTLWSLWLSWAVVLVVHYALGAWRERSP
jgi:membrane-associated PAP2 superfamily phosphatase